MTIANTEPARQPKQQPLAARLRRRTALVTRWLHIYLSMVSFAVVLFFAVTGLTLNHAEALSHGERVTELHGTLTPQELGSRDSPDKLAIVEHIRNLHGIHGAVSDMRVEEDTISFSFRGPGYTADTTVDRAAGTYQVIETRAGFIAIINDLHKGRDTGRVWSAVIDGSAVLFDAGLPHRPSADLVRLQAATERVDPGGCGNPGLCAPVSGIRPLTGQIAAGNAQVTKVSEQCQGNEIRLQKLFCKPLNVCSRDMIYV